MVAYVGNSRRLETDDDAFGTGGEGSNIHRLQRLI